MVPALLCLVLSLLSCSCEPARDPTTGLVRVLFIGDPFAYAVTPYMHLKGEPLFRMTAIPTSQGGGMTWGMIRRSMRLYMPRTYQDHLDRYDIVYMSDADVGLFKADQLMWFKRGVVECGQGLLMVGGWGSFGGRYGFSSWGGSSVGDVLPVDCVPGDACAEETCVQGGLFPMPADPEHEFCKPLPWDRSPPFSGMNTVRTRESANEVLVTRRRRRVFGGPILVYWDIGEGSSLAHTPDLTPGWVGGFSQWEYFPDYVMNMVYLLARLEVPQDIALVHAARIAMADYAAERALLVGLSEFVERFGASSLRIEKGLEELAGMKAEVDILYVDQNYEAALAGLQEIMVSVRDLGGEAVRIKNRALVWIFVIEWFVVTGTSVLCGFLLWSLMVKRRLYKEVHATRLGKIGPDRGDA